MANSKHYDVAVIGLGYVGLTLATCMAKSGLKVIGIEKITKIVRTTNNGTPHFYEQGLAEMLKFVLKNKHFIATNILSDNTTCGAYIITVGTPLDNNGNTRLDMIKNASLQVAKHMQNNALVILRSTVKIGTCSEIVLPILNKSDKKFLIAMCPERTLEGRALIELYQLPQIVGANSKKARQKAADLFKRLTHTIIEVSSLETAEMVKLIDNTYRDISFAFANEVARLCEGFGISAYEVINAGKQDYKRTNVALPGPVGGPCLEKDPYILIQSAQTKGINLEITKACRLVNERQIQETVAFIVAEIKRRGFANNIAIAILGIAFKGIPATNDLRGSTSLKILKQLHKQIPQLQVRLYDPEIDANTLNKQIVGYQTFATTEDAIKNVGVIIIANNHPELSLIEPIILREKMLTNGFIYDYWNTFSQLSKPELDNYYALGNTNK